MSKLELISLPVTGMDCANCATAVERSIKTIEEVNQVNVNLASERASFENRGGNNTIFDVIDKVKNAGYGIAVGEARLIITGLVDEKSSVILENRIRNLTGITQTNMNWVSGKVSVNYIPTLISQIEIREEIQKAGFEAQILGDQNIDTEEMIRQQEFRNQRKDLLIGLILNNTFVRLIHVKGSKFVGSVGKSILGELVDVGTGNSSSILCRQEILHGCCSIN